MSHFLFLIKSIAVVKNDKLSFVERTENNSVTEESGKNYCMLDAWELLHI